MRDAIAASKQERDQAIEAIAARFSETDRHQIFINLCEVISKATYEAERRTGSIDALAPDFKDRLRDHVQLRDSIAGDLEAQIQEQNGFTRSEIEAIVSEGLE